MKFWVKKIFLKSIINIVLGRFLGFLTAFRAIFFDFVYLIQPEIVL